MESISGSSRSRNRQISSHNAKLCAQLSQTQDAAFHKSALSATRWGRGGFVGEITRFGMHPRPPSKTTRILVFTCIVYMRCLTLLRSPMYGVGVWPMEVPAYAVQRIFIQDRYMLQSALYSSGRRHGGFRYSLEPDLSLKSWI